MSDNRPIGVFDSGIGGLTVVKELRELMPAEDIIYFGDTARTPYGSRPPAQILEFMHEILRFLQAQDVKMAVVACNTMTALGLDTTRKQYPFLMVGVNTGIRLSLSLTKNKRIGVIATQATIASGKHGKVAKEADPTATIFPVACPKFVPLVESGKLAGVEAEEAAHEYLRPLVEANVDTLILGCTHYPLLAPTIRKVMGANVTLVNPARETAVDACNLLKKHQRLTGKQQGATRLCFSADLERVKVLERCIFSGPQPEFELINLADYAK
ncbi:MAG: glutamate racemase [Negativicutes bacterium]|nr:glutamate racemase [Negativicutes bacterium]